MKIWTFFLSGHLALCCAAFAEDLAIQEIQLSGESEVRLRFWDGVTGGVRYSVFQSPDMRSWGTTGVQTDSVGLGDRWHELFAPAAGGRSFYQVKSERVQAVVMFSLGEITLGESSGSQEVVINFVDEAGQPLIYNGPVSYLWEGTAGAVSNLTGSVIAGGQSVTIPLDVVDNDEVEALKQISLTLEVDAQTGYLVDPAASSTTLTIEENDNYWRGSFQTGTESLDLELFIQRSAAGSVISLTKGTGFLSGELLVADSVTHTEANFQVAFPAEMMTANEENLVTEGTQATLSLTAADGMVDQSVDEKMIKGVGVLTISHPDMSYLNTTISGAFLILQDPPIQPTQELELE